MTFDRQAHERTRYPKRRAYFLARANKRTAEIAAIKLAAGCADCGYAEHSAALDFDHRPDEEKCFGIGKASTRSWASVEAEMAKCDVVCSNCHRVRTYERRADELVLAA